MNIKVCVGSSCHLKGSYDVILAMKDQGVNMKTDDISENMMKKASISTEDGFLLLHNVTKDNAEELFVKEIYPLIEI